MSRPRPQFVNLLRCLLVATMLCAQGAALAHEIDHGLVTDTELCASCTIGGGLHGAVTSHHDQPVDRQNRALRPVFAPPASPARVVGRVQARAPPRHS